MFRVLSTFADLQDDKHLYKPGDTFPRQGLTVDAARIANLASCDNATGKPLIKRVEASEAPVEASESEPKEIPAENVEPPKKARRSRQKG